MRLEVQRLVPVTVPVEVPAEILVEIFSHLPRRDIKAIRVVCKNFEAASSQYLFDRLYVSPQKFHLKILAKVSQHPVYSKYVEEIVYDCSLFRPELLCIEAYEAELLVYGHPFDKQWLERAHERYCRHYYQQEEIIAADADFKALCSALHRMPKVTIVSLIDGWESCGHVDEYGSNRGNQPSNTLGTYNARILERPYDVPLARRWEDFSKCPRFLRPAPWEYLGEEMEKGVRGFHVVFRAMSLSQHRIQTFFVDSNTDAMDRGIPSTFLCMSPSYLQTTCNVFKYLRRIVLEIMVMSETDLEDGKVAKMLSAAESLEDLRIGVYPGLLESFSGAKKILGSKAWARLQTVDFLSLEMKEKDLVEFCERHSGSLRNVGFEGVHLDGCKWSKAFFSLLKLNLQLDNVEAPNIKVRDHSEQQFISRKLARYLSQPASRRDLFFLCDDE